MFRLSGLIATTTRPATALTSGVLTTALSVAFGVVVGFSLGLTGGGGSIFAVPLLVYGLKLPAQEAVGVSLAAVAGTSLFGLLHRLRAGEVEVGTGLLFAAAGMLGAPIGTRLGALIPGAALLLMFAVLMLFVAFRMWRKAMRTPDQATAVRAVPGPSASQELGPACQRDPEGKLRWTSRCAMMLSLAGLMTGVLSGLFGVGGGFVIVPALVFFSGMGIHRAVATSLLVITLIGASGVVSNILLTDRPLPLELTGLFVAGGVGGMWLGTHLGRRISGPRLQKIFAAAMVAVATYIVAKNLAAGF